MGTVQRMLLRAGVMVLMGLTGACGSGPAPRPADIRIDDAHSGGTALAFSPSGRLLASGGTEGNLRLWDAATGRPVDQWQAHSHLITGIGFLDDGRIVTSSYDGTVALWSDQGRLVRRERTPAPVMHMVVDRDARRAVTGHDDGAVRVWRLPQLSLARTYTTHRGAVRAVAHFQGRVASSGTDGRVVVHGADGEWHTLASPPTDAHSLIFAPDGRHLYGGGWFDLFRWDLHTGSLTVLDTEHRGIVKALAFRHGGDVLGTISRQTDSAVYLLDPVSGAIRAHMAPHELCGADIAFSPQGTTLATTSDDASVRLWKLPEPQ